MRLAGKIKSCANSRSKVRAVTDEDRHDGGHRTSMPPMYRRLRFGAGQLKFVDSYPSVKLALENLEEGTSLLLQNQLGNLFVLKAGILTHCITVCLLHS